MTSSPCLFKMALAAETLPGSVDSGTLVFPTVIMGEDDDDGFSPSAVLSATSTRQEEMTKKSCECWTGFSAPPPPPAAPLPTAPLPPPFSEDDAGDDDDDESLHSSLIM